MLARSYIYWPDIDSHVQNYVDKCAPCQMTRNVKCEKLESKQWPPCEYPFERIYLIFFYFASNTFLILVDAYSKFIDVKLMPRTNNWRKI